MEPEPKTEKFDIRLPRGMRTALDAIHKRRGTKDSNIGLELLKAFIAAEERNSGVALPMIVMMAGEAATPEVMEVFQAAEDAGGYATGEELARRHLLGRDPKPAIPAKKTEGKAKA